MNQMDASLFRTACPNLNPMPYEWEKFSGHQPYKGCYLRKRILGFGLARSPKRCYFRRRKSPFSSSKRCYFCRDLIGASHDS